MRLREFENLEVRLDAWISVAEEKLYEAKKALKKSRTYANKERTGIWRTRLARLRILARATEGLIVRWHRPDYELVRYGERS